MKSEDKESVVREVNERILQAHLTSTYDNVDKDKGVDIELLDNGYWNRAKNLFKKHILQPKMFQEEPLFKKSAVNYKHDFKEKGKVSTLNIMVRNNITKDTILYYQTSPENILELQKYGLTHSEALTSQVIEVMGSYRLQVAKRALHYGIKTNKVLLKLRILDNLNERIKQLQPLERLINCPEKEFTYETFETFLKSLDDLILLRKEDPINQEFKAYAPNYRKAMTESLKEERSETEKLIEDLFKDKTLKETLSRNERNYRLQNFLRKHIDRALMNARKVNAQITQGSLPSFFKDLLISFFRGQIDQRISEAITLTSNYVFAPYSPITSQHQLNFTEDKRVKGKGSNSIIYSSHDHVGLAKSKLENLVTGIIAVEEGLENNLLKDKKIKEVSSAAWRSFAIFKREGRYNELYNHLANKIGSANAFVRGVIHLGKELAGFVVLAIPTLLKNIAEQAIAVYQDYDKLLKKIGLRKKIDNELNADTEKNKAKALQDFREKAEGEASNNNLSVKDVFNALVCDSYLMYVNNNDDESTQDKVNHLLSQKESLQGKNAHMYFIDDNSTLYYRYLKDGKLQELEKINQKLEKEDNKPAVIQSLKEQYSDKEDALFKLSTENVQDISSNTDHTRALPLVQATPSSHLQVYKPDDVLTDLVGSLTSIVDLVKDDIGDKHPLTMLTIAVVSLSGLGAVVTPELFKTALVKVGLGEKTGEILRTLETVTDYLAGGSPLAKGVTLGFTESKVVGLVTNTVSEGTQGWLGQFFDMVRRDPVVVIGGIAAAYGIGITIDKGNIPVVSNFLKEEEGKGKWIEQLVLGGKLAALGMESLLPQGENHSKLVGYLSTFVKVPLLFLRAIITPFTLEPWKELADMAKKGLASLVYNSSALIRKVFQIPKAAIKIFIDAMFVLFSILFKLVQIPVVGFLRLFLTKKQQLDTKNTESSETTESPGLMNVTSEFYEWQEKAYNFADNIARKIREQTVGRVDAKLQQIMTSDAYITSKLGQNAPLESAHQVAPAPAQVVAPQSKSSPGSASGGELGSEQKETSNHSSAAHEIMIIHNESHP
jgi:hypothetical protein